MSPREKGGSVRSRGRVEVGVGTSVGREGCAVGSTGRSASIGGVGVGVGVAGGLLAVSTQRTRLAPSASHSPDVVPMVVGWMNWREFLENSF